MNLRFTDIFYDNVREMPLAVLIDEADNCYYYPVSLSAAEELLMAAIDSNVVNVPLADIINDLIKYAQAKIISLVFDNAGLNCLTGCIKIDFNLDTKEYLLSPEKLILMSLIFNKNITVASSEVNSLYSAESYLNIREQDYFVVN